ncbi:T9SS type A sorting domain-containing protein [Catalinimonas niigatensis]|uniref:T9SS type A sorting domain-containing protein n=1 Tax=Catalinimonas niigatensis TaxID=1397264 RepID=UPI002666E8CD|nr:T9SS type A sorting domain-containing protein [Catalinimonas niigatensis]WPP48567.1 T9SS type A sorting domain-containing protein [Catalinimonas niigatensis]
MKQLYKIYYSAILAFVLLNVPNISEATHLIGGEITATVTNCQSYTYEINVILFRDPGSDIEFGMGEFYIGHGQTIELYGDAFSSREVINEDSTYTVMTFSLQHTFPGAGVYTMSFRDFNRNGNVVNMRNAVQTPFYTETQLMVDPLLGCNSTPQLGGGIDPLAYTKSAYSMSLEPTDSDGDSLSFELITPMQDLEEQVEGYRLPHKFDIRFAPQPSSSSGDAAPSLTVNNTELLWDAPNLGGEFALALRVNEWREVEGEWKNIGYITRDFSVYVMDTINHTLANDYVTAVQQEVVKPKVNMYPNPTPGPFTLEIIEDQWLGGTVSIYNILGQEMMQEAIVLGENKYDISSASQGIYFLTLQNGDRKKTIRFTKR